MAFRKTTLLVLMMSMLTSVSGFSLPGFTAKDGLKTAQKKHAYPANCPNCPVYFDDWVATHEKAYRAEGIQPRQNFAALQKLLQQNKLVRVQSNKYYQVSLMTYSKPYFLPKAKKFLIQLAQEYKENCLKAGVRYIPFHITSGTRTINSVRQLNRVNENSIANSAHLRGKTLDISYTKFGSNHKQRVHFIKALRQLQQQKKCYVKYERNGCLHITVI